MNNYPNEGDICDCGGTINKDINYKSEHNSNENYYYCDECDKEFYYD